MFVRERTASRRFFGLLSTILLASPASPAGAADATAPTRIGELVVTATRLPTPAAEIGSVVTVITEDDIRARQATSVADILRTVPGLAVSRSGGGIGTQTQVRIRGAEANQTLVLIDGVKANDPGLGSEFDFGHMLTSGIARIEVLRGPQSVLYGSDAIGGVVNIITKRGSGEPAVSAAVEGGSFGTRRADLASSGELGRFDYAVYATGYHTGGISIASRKRGFSENDGYEQHVGGGRIGFAPLENLRFDLTGRWSEAWLDTDGFSGAASPNIVVDDLSQTRLTQRFGRAQTELDLLEGRWRHTLGVSAADWRSDFRQADVLTSQTDGSRRTYDYQTSLAYATDPLAAQHSTLLGTQYDTEHVVSRSAFSDVDRRLQTASVFGQQSLGVAETVFLTAAGRHDWNDLFADSDTYRVTAAWLVAPGTRLSASYGTAVKAPTVFELFGFTANFRGNPNLVPEESRGWEAGIEQRLLEDRLTLGAVWFDNRIDNLIQGFGATARNVPGESHARGLELSATFRASRALDLSASYTFMNTTDAAGLELVRRPRHLASATLTYRFLEDRASLTGGIDYNGATQDLVFFPFPQPAQRFVLDGYTLLRVAGAYRLTEALEVFGRVENALNEQYEEVFSYATPGRAGYVGLRAAF